MNILLNKLFLSLIAFFILNYLKGQNLLNESRFLKFDVKELRYKLEKDWYVESNPIVLGYRGSILGGINGLINISQTRICYEGLIPEKTIDYKIEYYNDSLIDVKSYILRTLADVYKFKVIDTFKIAETYRLTIIDSSKLIKSGKYKEIEGNYNKCGFSNLKMKYDYDHNYILHKYMCLKCLAEIFEINLNIIVNIDTNDTNDYDFIFPPYMTVMFKFRRNEIVTIESINEYFGEKYGLRLVKETRMEKFKLIKFHN